MNKSAKRYSSTLAALLQGLLVVLLLASCSAPAVPAESGEAAPSEAAPGGTLVIARPTDAVGLDPKVETTSPGNWVTTNVYENLVKLDTDLTFQPALAESWEQIEPDRWRFYLRHASSSMTGPTSPPTPSSSASSASRTRMIPRAASNLRRSLRSKSSTITP